MFDSCLMKKAIAVICFLWNIDSFVEELFVCFEDFEKAFYRVKWTKFFELHQNIRDILDS